jgi:hypothetical protein
MAICDLCGYQCSASKLEQLIELYKVPGVTDICPSCSRWAAKTKGDMLGKIPAAMREAITQRKGNPPRPWWHRFVPSRVDYQPPPPAPPRPPA